MSDETRFNNFGLLIPKNIDPAYTNQKIYEQQYKEAESIIRYFEGTPVQILADDVGTGKTWVAMMALFSKLNEGTKAKSRTQTRHALVVAPSTLVASKWERELKRFNRYFVDEPDRTSIDRVSSIKDLLAILRESNKMSAESTIADQFRSNKTDVVVRRTNASALLLIHILEENTALRRDNNCETLREAFENLKSHYQKQDKSPIRNFFSAALPHRKIEKLIPLLIDYIYTCSKQSIQWYMHDFDREIWLKRKNKKKARSKFFAEALCEAITGEVTKRHKHLDDAVPDSTYSKNYPFVRFDHIVQIISVLWGVNQRISIIPTDVVLNQKVANEIREKLLTSEPTDVLRTVAALIIKGLPNEMKSCTGKKYVRTLHDMLRPYQTNGNVLVVEEEHAIRITDMLGAFAARVKDLCGTSLAEQYRFMNLYSAAAVFEDANDLFKLMELVKKEEKWEPLIELLTPMLSANLKKAQDERNHMCEGKRLANIILQLMDYELHPDRVGSTFWTEKPKKRAIHVIKITELPINRKGSKSKNSTQDLISTIEADATTAVITTSNESSTQEVHAQREVDVLDKALKNTKPISIAVIDEAHNWKGLKKGAPDYGKFIQRHVQRTLLVTATPVHMSVNDLKNIIDLGHCNKTTSKRARSFDQFIRSYNALFAKDKDKHLLTAAKQLQEKVAKCWTKLAGNKEALDLIKASQVRLDRQPIVGNMRAAQLKEWDSLSKLSNKPSVQSLRELADAVLELRQFQDDQLLKYLRLLIVKRRAEKHITRDNGQIGTRRYLCGHECSTEALSDHQNPPADDVHLLFHDTGGIEQGDNTWVNLIGMRLSQLPFNESDQTQNARLMVGLPSSYAALTQSALLKDVQNKKNQKPVDKRPEVTRLYAGVFSRCTTNMDVTHPKVKRTVDIVLANLLNGRKTLVFCQRLATVDVLAEQINRRVTDYLKAQFRDLPSINTKDSPLDMLDRAIACAQRNASIFDLTGKPIPPNSFDAFKKYMHSSSSEKSISANHYDARLVWLVNKIVDAMFASEAESKVKREVKTLLQAQKVDLTSPEDTKNANESPQLTERKTVPSVHKIFDVVQKVTSKAGNSDSSLANFSSPFFPLVLICSPVSQEGVDMHKYCCTIVLHDLNWNPAILEQRIGRLDRVGSFASELKLPVDVFVPFLADSYDEYQYRRVLQRAELQELLFGRNDKNICDKELIDTNDEHNVESKDADVPLLGNLIYGLFDMDLSAESRSDEK